VEIVQRRLAGKQQTAPDQGTHPVENNPELVVVSNETATAGPLKQKAFQRGKMALPNIPQNKLRRREGDPAGRRDVATLEFLLDVLPLEERLA
jgi:hypothetical protein